jgi:hypothetical protein
MTGADHVQDVSAARFGRIDVGSTDASISMWKQYGDSSS